MTNYNPPTSLTGNLVLNQGIYAAAPATLTDGDIWPILLDSKGRQILAGTYAEDSVHANADTGMLVLGVTNQSLTAQTSAIDGDYGAIAINQKGQVLVAATVQTAGADGYSNSGPVHMYDKGGSIGPMTTVMSRFNGTSWDRERNNMEASPIASAAKTATNSTADITNYNGQSVNVVIDVTAIVTAPSITATIEGKDPASGKYYPLLVSAAITTVSTVVLQVGRGLTAAAGLIANASLPRTWRITMTHSNANSITYSVGYSLNV